jgi:hypothetical protein
VPGEVAQAVASLEEATARVEQAEAELVEAKSHLNFMRTVNVPEVFNRFGITAAESTSGARAKTTQFITGSLPKADDDPGAHDTAIRWLEEHGLMPLIKTKVEAKYGREERQKALDLYNQLRGDNSAEVKIDETVHPQTLHAMVRDRLRSGEEIALDVLGVTVQDGVRLTKRSTRNNEGSDEPA